MDWSAGKGFLSAGGTRLEYACWGPAPDQAPTIVLLHEGLGCVALWRDFPAKLAKEVAESVSIPIIGIGAGGHVDGQVLVVHDMLGMTHEFHPRFLRRYLGLYDEMSKAVSQYVNDVKSKDFPNEEESY